MKRPEKKDTQKHFVNCDNCNKKTMIPCKEWHRLYNRNQTIDDMDSYLPSETELGSLIFANFKDIPNFHINLAKILFKRIRE